MHSEGIRFLAAGLFLSSRTSSVGLASLRSVALKVRRSWRCGCRRRGGGGGVGGWGGGDIICVLGGEIMFGIKASASLGWGIYLSVVLHCPGYPSRQWEWALSGAAPLCLCVHLFGPMLLSSGELHRLFIHELLLFTVQSDADTFFFFF